MIESINKKNWLAPESVALWSSAVLAGLVAVFYAKLFRLAEGFFHSQLEAHPRWVFIITPSLFSVAWWVVARFAPEASGSGIPQVMAANEIQDLGKVHRLLSMRTALVKVVSSLLCVLGGGAIGREGPTLQICSSLFYFVGERLKPYIPQISRQTWVVAGAAAGLASAFNTPLGGIVYAIEELGVSHFHKVRSALISAVIISGIVAQSILGPYLYLGFPNINKMTRDMIPAVIACGVLTGLGGASFGRLLLYLVNQRRRVQGLTRLAVLTVATGLVMATMSYFDSRAAGTGTELITGFLFRGEMGSATLALTRFAATIVSYMSGAAGGIFSPSLAVGGAMGSYFAHFFSSDHANLMVLLGMIGFLTGVTRTPFTSFILVLEMTDRHVAIFPMMSVALIAHWAARFVDAHSFYEHMKERYV